MLAIKILILLLTVVHLQVNIANASDFICTVNTFVDDSLKTVKKRFSTFDKIYVQSLCHNLLPGYYEFTVVWHLPSGQIQRQDVHTFNLQIVSDYSVFFWIKLLKKSTIQEAVSNGSYSDKYYGQWTVNVYLNEQSIGAAPFTVQ